MEILRYTLEDAEGNEEGSYFFETYEEAKTRAMTDHLRVICNEFEFSDSYMVDDFTDTPAKWKAPGKISR